MLTITDAVQGGYGIASNSDHPMPANASNINWTNTKTVANLALTPTSTTSQITFYNGGTSTVDLIADCSGYFS